MSVSTVGSSSPYQLQWPSQSGVDSTDKSGAPSDPLLALFAAFKGGGQADAMEAPPPPPDGSSGNGPQFSSDTMSAMISMLGGGTSLLDNLIGKFDTDSDGKISQDEFEKAAGADADKTRADALFSKIDADGDGTVTRDELAQAIQKAHGHRHHHHAEEAGGVDGMDPLQAASSSEQAKGASRQSVTNADGSTTITITYGDGSKISMTTPPTNAASASDSTDGNSALNAMNLKSIIQKMIAAQAQMFAQQQAATDVSA